MERLQMAVHAVEHHEARPNPSLSCQSGKLGKQGMSRALGNEVVVATTDWKLVTLALAGIAGWQRHRFSCSFAIGSMSLAASPPSSSWRKPSLLPKGEKL